MWWFVGGIFVIGLGLVIFCILKVASDADDCAERLYKEQNREANKEG